MNKTILKKTFPGLILIITLSLATACTQALPAQEASSFKTMSDEQLIAFNKEKIDEEIILSTVKELTSEKYQGRRTGTEGNTLAAEYIANQYREIGLSSPEGLDNYKQHFNHYLTVLDSKPTLTLKDKTGAAVKNLEFSKDFLFSFLPKGSDSFHQESSIYIIQGKEDMVSQKVKDKVVLVPAEVIKEFGSINNLSESAFSAGASWIIREIPAKPVNGFMKIGPIQLLERNNVPIVIMNPESYKTLTELVKNTTTLELEYQATLGEEKDVYNVIGAIEGKDEALKDECIIISAHFDQMGNNHNGTYNPGALDNASGTSALMELARIIKQNNISSKKTILFIAFNSEETILEGSEYYAANPIYPLEKSTVINLDMLGSKEVSSLTIDGTEELEKVFWEMASVMNVEFDKEDYAGGDHQVLINAGAKGIVLGNQVRNTSIHTPGDTVDKLDKIKLEEAASLVVYYLQKVQ